MRTRGAAISVVALAWLAGGSTISQASTVPTATSLSTPGRAATNQDVTLVATVSAGTAGPDGFVVFEANGAPIPGCAGPVSPSVPIASCQTSFAAGPGPVALSATFVPYSFTNLASSTSATSTLTLDKGASVTLLSVSRPATPRGARTIYTATVASSAPGPAIPSGLAEFLDNGSLIPACGVKPLGSGGTARCAVIYPVAGKHQITVRYSGDASFLGSTSAPAPSFPRRVTATMHWTFYFTPSYTKVRALTVSGAPTGETVTVSCGGPGCPFARLSPSNARGSARKRASLDLTSTLHTYAFPIGTTLRVAIARPGWVGKFYRFTIRSGRPPAVMIACLPPGQTRPGGSC